jgi:outer membrane protein, adhesin transport system
MRLKFSATVAAITLLCGHAAFAQTDTTAPLKAAAQKAVSSNPEVTARFNAYRAAADAIDAARGGYYPRVDLSASVGRDRDRITSRSPETQSLSRNGVALSLTQLLWDGLATVRDVGRLSHERVARYFDVLEATEQTALEATRAYYDVLRFRRLVQLAEDNFVQHQSAFNQIQSRFKAGVGRGVDLEQAGARLALAESNLNTELANLHDVSARYQRVVGEAPARDLPLPPALKAGLPGTALDASHEAVRRSPAISASVETLRAARSLASAREGAYQPQVQARLRSGGGKNFDGVPDQKRDSSAEIVLNWNLFSGGADRARVRQQANVVNQAADLRDKTCRDTRQTVAIAYNDTRKLVDQLVLLDRNTLAITKARDAYRQQFEIGQRSLLDLLNAENELYTAQRAYANAEYDLHIAYARAHAAMSQLGRRRQPHTA